MGLVEERSNFAALTTANCESLVIELCSRDFGVTMRRKRRAQLEILDNGHIIDAGWSRVKLLATFIREFGGTDWVISDQRRQDFIQLTYHCRLPSLERMLVRDYLRQQAVA